MRVLRIAIAAGLLCCAGAAQATTVIVFVEPMTMERYTRVYDTPGRDRVLLCMAPPAEAGCTELPVRKTARR